MKTPFKRIASGMLSISLVLAGGIASATTLAAVSASPAHAASVTDGPITRSEVLARAQSWVGKGYVYGRTYYDPQGSPYRGDCSGFVSMALHIGWSPNTEELPPYLVQIPKDELLPGDIVGAIGPNTSGDRGHVVIFNGWTDGSHATYRGYEFGSTPGAQYNTINYPHGAGDNRSYAAYRYKKILDDAPNGTVTLKSTMRVLRTYGGCILDVAIKSVANGLYVSAERDYVTGDKGMLRARASAPGAWERFRVCYDGNGLFTFRAAANNQLVAAELGYGGGDYGMLRARSIQVGPWERFSIGDIGSYVLIGMPANGRLVSAELGYGGGDKGMLRARAGTPGAWEQFI